MKFKVKSALPRSEAIKLAGAIYKYQYAMTENAGGIRDWNDMKILEYLHKNFLPDWPPDRLISQAQDFFNSDKLPLLNLVPVKIKTGGSGKISSVDPKTKIPVATSHAGMDLPINDCWAKFERSYQLLLQSIERADFDIFLDSLSAGRASIESYLNMKAYLLNEENKSKNLPPVITRKEIERNSINTKILKWPEKLTGKPGRITEGCIEFICWKRLKKLRDEMATHPKGPRETPSPHEFLNLLNSYRYGIAGLLMQLHKSFDDSIHFILICASFFPQIELVADNEERILSK